MNDDIFDQQSKFGEESFKILEKLFEKLDLDISNKHNAQYDRKHILDAVIRLTNNMQHRPVNL